MVTAGLASQICDGASAILICNEVRTMRVELIGNSKPCMTEIYIYIDARMADYIHTHP